MMATNLALCFSLLTLLPSTVCCSSEGQVNLGGVAGSSSSAGSAGFDYSPFRTIRSNAMTVLLGDTQYDYSCEYTEFGSGLDKGVGWEGMTVYATSESSLCVGWSETNPELQLSLNFTGHLVSVGFPPGAYDLATPTMQNIVVTFYVTSQVQELRVGQTRPYANYSSTSGEPFDNEPTPPAVGVSGTVLVARWGPDYVEDDPSDSSPPYHFPEYDVRLSNVVLPMLGSSGSDFPSTVTIDSARVTSHQRKR